MRAVDSETCQYGEVEEVLDINQVPKEDRWMYLKFLFAESFGPSISIKEELLEQLEGYFSYREWTKQAEVSEYVFYLEIEHEITGESRSIFILNTPEYVVQRLGLEHLSIDCGLDEVSFH